MLETAIGYLQFLGQKLVTARLPAVFHHEIIHENPGDEEKYNSQSQFCNRGGREIKFLQRHRQIRTVSRRGERGPKKRANRPVINGGGDDAEIIDWVVAAVDSDVAGVVEQ